MDTPAEPATGVGVPQIANKLRSSVLLVLIGISPPNTDQTDAAWKEPISAISPVLDTRSHSKYAYMKWPGF